MATSSGNMLGKQHEGSDQNVKRECQKGRDSGDLIPQRRTDKDGGSIEMGHLHQNITDSGKPRLTVTNAILL